MKRFNPNIKNGLSSEQVSDRINNKLINIDSILPTKSYKQIILENIFTLFNIINLFLGIIIFLTGTYKNLTFLGVAFFNTFISMIQEIRSKYTIDMLSIISKSKVNVIRDGESKYIDVEDIVLDDIIKHKLGDQIVVDSIVRDGIVEVNESFLTGESDAIVKRVGDKLLSGSFIVSGNCICQVDSVGSDSYANKISSEAKYLKKIDSEIMFTLNKIIKIISVLIIPLGIILYIKQLHITGNINDAIIGTVAAIIGTIPEGLVLLTSTVLAVSSIRLAKKNILVQQLYCIETLARVDTICLDKTGTLTTGNMNVVDVISLNSNYNIKDIMSNISYYMDDNNSTSNAINKYFDKSNNYKLVNKINFSSEKKYSVYEFEDNTYIVGAPEFIKCNNINYDIDKLTKKYRVLLLGVSKEHIIDNKIDSVFIPVGLILIEDEIRHGVKDTLDYIKSQDVSIKIISGDNVDTVHSIAKKVGLSDLKICDMSTNKKNLKDIVEEYDIFGRVTPNQKKELVLALKSLGHKVAMTGDGVNDVLSLKEADCSIAVASGSDAARNVSEIVLLDSDFKEIPSIIKEGRRTINNLERSATLFLTKTIYATIIAILFTIITMDYPFIPIQFTLINVITIGIPSFILALEPNHNRVKGKFIINVFSKSLPSALTIIVNIISIIILSKVFNIDSDYISTMAVILVAFTGFILLFKVCLPFNYMRASLFGTLIGIFICSSIGLHKLFELVMLTPYQFIFIIILCIIDVIIFTILTKLCNKLLNRYESKLLR